MRALWVCICVWLWCVGPSPLALAQPAATSNSEATTELGVTVTEHTMSVQAGSAGTTVTERWSLRVDVPEVVGAGVPIPSNFDGATSQGAKVFGDLAIFPEAVKAGQVFTFLVRQKLPRYASARFESIPDIPVESVTMDISSSGGVPISLWADDAADIRFSKGSSPRATVTWPQGHGLPMQVVWTTFPDWKKAGEAFASRIEARMASREELGRRFAGDLRGLRPRSIAKRVYELVEYSGDSGSFAEARSALAIARDGRGTAAERAVLIINLLRLAGFEASAGLYLPRAEVINAPITLPAPDLYSRPIVIIRDAEVGIVYIDPSNERVMPPTVPYAMRGGLVWPEGDAPYSVARTGIFHGQLSIAGQLALARDGSAAWNLSLTGSDTAAEILRDRLGELSNEEQKELLGQLARVAIPGLTRLQVETAGLQDVERPIRIQVSGYVADQLGALGPGLQGRVKPLIGPALTAWMPGGIEVIEEIAIRRPPDLLPLSIKMNSDPHVEQATVTMSLVNEGTRLTLTTRSYRPDTQGRPVAEHRAERLLHQRAQGGADIVFFPWPDSQVVAALRSGRAGLTILEAHVLEGLAWWREPEERRGRRAFKRALTVGTPEQIAEVIHAYGDPSNPLAWEGLLELLEPADQLVAIKGLEADGHMERAWRRALPLRDSLDKDLRLEARLVMARTQPAARPDQRTDSEAYDAWTSREQLLLEARQLASDLGRDAELATILRKLAEAALESGNLEESQEHIDAYAAVAPFEEIAAMAAEVRTRNGGSVGEARRLLAVAGALDERDAIHASRALAEAGDLAAASRWADIAARLAPNSAARWDQLSNISLLDGDLRLALQSAERASNLDPSDNARARRLQMLATMAGDRGLAQLAAKRAGEKPTDILWPTNFEHLLAMTAPEHLLAVLSYHDLETTQKAAWLRMRAQLFLDAGKLPEAGRDGALLVHRFNDLDGYSMVLGASAGRMVGSRMEQDLARAARTTPNLRRAWFEYLLITGSPDAAGLAKELAEDQAVAAAAQVFRTGKSEGWANASDPPLSVRGYTNATLLGRPEGVSARATAMRARAVVRHKGSDMLPPPLSLLYTPRERPVDRREDGVNVYRLDGGVLGVYAAVHRAEGITTIGLGFSAVAAERAVDESL